MLKEKQTANIEQGTRNDEQGSAVLRDSLFLVQYSLFYSPAIPIIIFHSSGFTF